MKILMLGWELPPHNSGGLGVACYQLSKHLARKGVDIDFVLPYQSPPEHQPSFMKLHGALPATAEQLFFAGGAYDSACYVCTSDECDHRLPSSLRDQQHMYTKFVEQLVTKADYKAIHAHDWLTFEAGLRAKQLTGKPLIAHVHATEFDRAGMRRGNPLVHDIETNTLLMADRIIAVSHLTKALIAERYHIPAEKIDVVHNSIDPEEMDWLDESNSYTYLQAMKQRGYKVVVSLARLSLQKGLHQFLEAASQVLRVDPKVLFLVVGDGELRDELILRSAELGIAHNVIFTGFLRGKRWRDAYAIGDMFVMSSISEPFGLTALEAAGHHNAILLSKQCGVRETLKSVVTFDFWDTTKLADAILNIAQHETLANALADGAQREFGTMSWENAARQLHSLYGALALAGVKT